ncbi:glutathione S-transferase family protein [Microvirga terricola]|uniref:glutathione transferase n=1 Tax=Microvirga terricola TaxID=2719797 RepID=A0ABX0VEZ8_9HYPH|nr:glutathione S-transferase family protein [Microvirga terricola]NIX78048.1 glutathione S-transferase family protein [Microvirga terricola]
MTTLTLVSSHLCPYVQRAAIALAEKGEPFERIYVDTADKPDWFKAISPLGKVPLLKVGDAVIFESAVILEYLEDTVAPKLHPVDPLTRADHRAWIEFGSTILNDIGGLYNAPDERSFNAKCAVLSKRFAWIEKRLKADPWFDGSSFSLVDAVFGPIFRYFDVFDGFTDLGIFADKPKVSRWRAALSTRPSVRGAVQPDYPERLRQFIAKRNSHLSTLLAAKAAA